MTNTQHIIINGDSRNMSELQDRSDHLIITSPILLVIEGLQLSIKGQNVIETSNLQDMNIKNYKDIINEICNYNNVCFSSTFDYKINPNKYYKIAEKSNDKNALYHLGLLYKGGHGVTKSLSKAFKYFEKASMQDVPDAFYQAGITAYKLKRYQDAQIYLEQAKGESNPYAYYLLSEMHYFDKIKNANMKDAEYYGRLAKSAGFKPSIKLKSKAN